MKYNNYSRKKRQLNNHIERLKFLIKKNDFSLENVIKKLVSKIQKLIDFLTNKISFSKLRISLGSLAIIFGLSSPNYSQAQTFAPPVLNPAGISIDSTSMWGKAELVDLDDDGDLDVLFSNSQYDYNNYSYLNGFTYEENYNPGFSLPYVSPFNLQSPFIFTDFSVLNHNLIDLDNDGDYDILSNLSGIYQSYDYSTYQYSIDFNSSFRYFENVGNSTLAQFTNSVTNPFGLMNDSAVVTSDIVDIDGDGDLDIIAISNTLDYSTYFFDAALNFIENIGDANNPIFSNPQINAFGLNNFSFGSSPVFTDIDGDNDLDLFVLESYDLIKFEYRQNKGTQTNPQFQSPVTNPFSLLPDTSNQGIALAPEFGDLDNDGDMDLVVGGEEGLSFYQNISQPSSVIENSNEFKIFPNPVLNYINIESKFNYDKIEIRDINGKVLISEINPNKNLLVNHLSQGTYIISLYKKNNKSSINFIKK